jgi:hypothetical protein
MKPYTVKTKKNSPSNILTAKYIYGRILSFARLTKKTDCKMSPFINCETRTEKGHPHDKKTGQLFGTGHGVIKKARYNLGQHDEC